MSATALSPHAHGIGESGSMSKADIMAQQPNYQSSFVLGKLLEKPKWWDVTPYARVLHVKSVHLLMDQATNGSGHLWINIFDPPHPPLTHHKPRSHTKSNYTTIFTILISRSVTISNDDLIQGAIAAVNSGQPIRKTSKQ